MLQIIECLNINNLIHKFSEVQENVGFAEREMVKKSQQTVRKQKGVPIKLIDFPYEELKNEDPEIITILKERRRAICEFIIKILNSFNLLNVSCYCNMLLVLLLGRKHVEFEECYGCAGDDGG